MAESGSRRITARLALGKLLRQYRTDAGLSGAGAADQLGWSQAKVSRIESARVRAEVSDVRALADTYNVSGQALESLLNLAEEAAGPSSEWRNSTGLGLSRRQQDFVSLEASASTIQHYQTMLIPGPLQTPEYTARVFSTFGVNDPSRAIETRKARRSAILRPGGPRLQVVLTEMAVRWDPGPTDILQSQLAALANLAEGHSNLDLRILPMSGQKRAFLAHPVAIYRFDDVNSPLALIETTTTDVRVTDLADVATLSSNLDRIIADCLNKAASIDFLRELVNRETIER